MSRAVLEISGERIRENCKNICKYTGKKIIAVVKSDAYGIGIRYIAPLLEHVDEVEYFAVASPDEGAILRSLGVRKKILVLGGVLREEIDTLLENRLIPVVSDMNHYRLVKDLKIPFHVKFDTGMGRLGFTDPVKLEGRVEGIMSHFSSPADKDFSMAQIEAFRRIVEKYKDISVIHMESSAGLIYNLDFTTHVRIGLAIYGEKPIRDYPVSIKPSLTLKARVISVKELPGGYPISYGRTYITRGRTKIGIVAFGYADGLMKSLSNKLKLMVGSQNVPVIGNITMDMTIVDITGTDVREGDWIYIVNEHQTFSHISKLAGTIPYEIMCNLSSRVERKIV